MVKTKNTNPPPPLKADKDSHMIKKPFTSPPSSSSSSASSLAVSGPIKPRPVIIYTHSPKIIHTHPKDFMALVQKLTGLSQSSEDDPSAPRIRKENGVRVAAKKVKINDDDESSSAVTDHENYGSIGGDGQCFMQSHPNYINNIPIFTPKLAEFLCANQPCYNNYTDPLFFSFSKYDFNNFCLGGED
ncbi:VQ motif-containing family protein [Salix suchowensis]|nr:VQ motif-containing family protein [Salix suchowensis]